MDSPDPVKRLIELARLLLGQEPPELVDELPAALAALAPRELVRSDEQSRSWLSGLDERRIAALAGAGAGDEAATRLWHVLGLVSCDGHERERAVAAAPPSALTARLLALRAIDWVPEVRAAALARLAALPGEVLAAALPLAAQLAEERHRGPALGRFVDERMSDADLRAAIRSHASAVRRAAWLRLGARGSLGFEELRDAAARDRDVLVRAVAADALASLRAGERRELASLLVADRVGRVAVPALAALVELDGPAAIMPALTARTAPLRRAARGWAALRGVDARAVYRERLAGDPGDAVALVALAELARSADGDLFRSMRDDSRARVRAAGLRALMRAAPAEARRAAIDLLRAGAPGRVTWAAADVLREGAPSTAEAAVLAAVAGDPARPPGLRMRALALLRPARWTHLVVLLESLQREPGEAMRTRLLAEVDTWVAGSGRIGRGPDLDARARIERLLPGLGDERGERIGFVLSTAPAR